jgi:SAM-dependent methyltransferase
MSAVRPPADHTENKLISLVGTRGRVVERLRVEQARLRLHAQTLEDKVSEQRRQVQRVVDQLGAFGSSRTLLGDLRRLSPVSAVWGVDRGRPIDRYYIEQFLDQHALDVRGVVLEVHDSNYTVALGGTRVDRSDVIDIDPTNRRATIVADLRRAPSIVSGTYDCFVMTQTLHVIYDMRAVLRECARVLKPGGVLLATLPCAGRLAPEQGLDGDFWRFTPAAARRLFCEFFPAGQVQVQAYGNVLTTIAYLYGLACHELTPGEFEAHDPAFPLIIGVRASVPFSAGTTERAEAERPAGAARP